MTYDYPIWYIFLSFLISGLLSFLMYKKNIKTSWKFYFMAFLRFISLLIVFVSIGTLVLTTEIEVKVKPKLIVAFDQSSSMLLNTDFSKLESVFNEINNSKLSASYQIKNIGFGEFISEIDTLKFNEPRTSLEDLENSLNLLLTKKDKVILVSDGNINKGSSYVFNKKHNYTLDVIGVGDTIFDPSISISKINYNKKVIVGNSFPLEIFIKTTNFSGEVKLEVSDKRKIILTDNISILPNADTEQRMRHSILLKSSSEGIHVYKIKLSSKNDESIFDEKFITVKFIKNRGVVFIKYSNLNPDISLFKREFTERNYKVVTTRNSISKKEIKKYDLFIDFDSSLKGNIDLPIILVNSSYKKTNNNWNKLDSGLDKKFLKSYSVNSISNRIYLETNNLWQLNLNEARRGGNKINLFFNSLVREVELLKYSNKFDVVFKDVYSSSEDVIIELINESSKLKLVNASAEVEISSRKQVFDFIEEDSRYSLNLGKLETKAYKSEIKVNGKKLKTINFTVNNVNLEMLGNHQNKSLLKNIVSGKNTALYSLENYKELIDKLSLKKDTIFISKTKKNNLLEEWWLLFLLPLILGAEWLLRKRNGLY